MSTINNAVVLSGKNSSHSTRLLLWLLHSDQRHWPSKFSHIEKLKTWCLVKNWRHSIRFKRKNSNTGQPFISTNCSYRHTSQKPCKIQETSKSAALGRQANWKRRPLSSLFLMIGGWKILMYDTRTKTLKKGRRHDLIVFVFVFWPLM